MTHSDPSIATGAPMVGDHLALDLLNTEAIDAGEMVDYWRSGEDVLDWLARYGVTPAAGSKVVRTVLLAQAKTLRTLARKLIVQQKEGRDGAFATLNAYLHAFLSAPHLARDIDGKLALTRVPAADSVATMLGQLAEAVAQLLVDGDFALVKQCEHPDCVLWFYDRTKAHKRRWCSMALCGNRYKAAQFRKKSAAASA
jgi:predicted RNA-binding Zn ribbon-like protein